jgi:hypothetical protein
LSTQKIRWPPTTRMNSSFTYFKVPPSKSRVIGHTTGIFCYKHLGAAEMSAFCEQTQGIQGAQQR